MPLGPKRSALQAELTVILMNPDKPLTGNNLAKALSNFSKGILPPTIGIFTGIAPAAAVYNAAPAMGKTKGIENAVNTFAQFNAIGMTPFLFTGIAPPKIRNLQKWFDMVRSRNGTVVDIAKLLSWAILVNYTLGSSIFNPLSIPIPTWNIGILPGAVRDELDQGAINAKMKASADQSLTAEQITDWRAGADGEVGTSDDLTGPEQDSFFDR